MKTASFFSVLAILATTATAQASPIVYRPMNPHISPNAYPSNVTAINDVAELTRPRNTGRSTGANRLSEAELIKQSTISGLSQRYTQLLTGTDSSSGTVSFGDGSYAEYSTVDDIRYITFFNLDGSTTEISFPL